MNLRSEAARLLSLAAVAAWLLHPFANNRQIGAGDALWYANMLADFVLQWRAGIFPVFAGQTIHAFNGAVYPLRVAPMYQHLAGIIDLLTGRHFGFFALQHLVVISCGVAGLFGCYFALCAIEPRHRWPAAALAVLYLSCPGMLAVVYTQDLYMTWTTVPFLPLAVFGIIRTFRKDTLTSQLWLAVPLAALWWAHSPIALWMTGIAAFTQLVRIAIRWNATSGSVLLGSLFAVITFSLLAQYPFVSVAALHTPGTISAVDDSLAHPGDIYANIRSVFPANILPLSDGAAKLSDLQLGYALGLILVLSAAILWRTASSTRRPCVPSDRLASDLPLGLLLASSLGLLLLLAPLPPVGWLWARFPEVIKRITLYWPMQRFYPILAALLAFCGQLALSKAGTELRAPSLILLLACAWSLGESRQFIRAGCERTASASASEIALRPENLMLMNHSYGLFPALPPYFSNGVMDPEAEIRLLAADAKTPLRGRDASPERPHFIALHGTLDANPGILDLSPIVHLGPGRHYSLDFEFGDHDYQGVLQFLGHTLTRQYLLPSSGGPLAFGTSPGATHSLTLWTTNPGGDDISLRFIPTVSGARPLDYADFGRVSVTEMSRSDHPTELLSLVPFRARVRSAARGWLETPRMYMPGYVATSEGRRLLVSRSPQGLVMVPVTPYVHFVELRFVGPALLRLSYWTACACWLIVAALASIGLVVWGLRRLNP